MNEKELRRKINKSPFLSKIFYRKLLNKKSFLYKKFNQNIVETKDVLNSTNPVIANIKNKDKLFVGLVKDGSRNNYYTKYEKFLIQNNIKYDYFDPYSSNFIEEAKRFNLIIWRLTDQLPNVQISKDKLFFIENILKIKVYPSFKDVWSYEDKSLEFFLFKEFGFEHIPSFYTNKYDEALNYIDRSSFPIISKELTSCSSNGVRLLKSKNKAKRFVKRVFGEGERSSFPWVKQKNYVLFQSFIKDAIADIRIVCIGGHYFAGYYRFAKKNDFRASGSGLVTKQELPVSLLETTRRIYKSLGYKHMFAVDFLETADHKYLIIETSQFIGIETPQQTKVNDVSGIYVYDESKNKFDFIEGDYWLQELDLKVLFESLE